MRERASEAVERPGAVVAGRTEGVNSQSSASVVRAWPVRYNARVLSDNVRPFRRPSNPPYRW